MWKYFTYLGQKEKQSFNINGDSLIVKQVTNNTPSEKCYLSPVNTKIKIIHLIITN